MIRSLLRWFAVSFGVILASSLLLIFSVRIGLFGSLPDDTELRNIQHHEASVIYSADGRILGSYFVQNRTEIELDEVSPLFTDALLAVEDIRFYEHNGFDRRAMLRVLVKTILLRQEAGGGSTLTQQLAKNLYPRQSTWFGGLVIDKIQEILIALRLEKFYSKNEILELYLNTVSFGEETFGVETAARRFFDKDPADLELTEAATLAGLLRAPGWYNPRTHPDRSLMRRNVVIRQMEKYGMIEPERADQAVNEPMSITYNRVTADQGPAPYFREHVRQELHTILDTLETPDGKNYNLYTDGLRIETTLDSQIQAAAEKAVITQLQKLQAIFDRQQAISPVFTDDDPLIRQAWRRTEHYQTLKENGLDEDEINDRLHQPAPRQLFSWDGDIEMNISPYDSLRHYLSFLNSGFLAIDANHGDILAWVGGIDFRYFKYDHIKSRRQAGSAFKPVVYSAALENGFEPCDYQRNRLSNYVDYDEWTPRNIRDEYGGYYSLQAALAHSVNTVSVELLMDTGVDEVRSAAERLGITSEIPRTPSIALGTAEVSLLEMTRAYSAFLNRGMPVQPRFLKAIYDSNGNLIADFDHPTNPNEKPVPEFDYPDDLNRIQIAEFDHPAERQETISEETAAAILRMLKKSVDEGTGIRLRTEFGIQHAVAGKTGTSQGFSDGWFIGMTPEIVFGTWVGGQSTRVRLQENIGYATQTALPVAGLFLKSISENEFNVNFSDQFTDEQLKTRFNMHCSDYRDENLVDRVRDFFRGRSADEPREVKTEEEKKSFWSRLKSIF